MNTTSGGLGTSFAYILRSRQSTLLNSYHLLSTYRVMNENYIWLVPQGFPVDPLRLLHLPPGHCRTRLELYKLAIPVAPCIHTSILCRKSPHRYWLKLKQRNPETTVPRCQHLLVVTQQLSQRLHPRSISSSHVLSIRCLLLLLNLILPKPGNVI
jgi:hypothetical protein